MFSNVIPLDHNVPPPVLSPLKGRVRSFFCDLLAAASFSSWGEFLPLLSPSSYLEPQR